MAVEVVEVAGMPWGTRQANHPGPVPLSLTQVPAAGDVVVVVASCVSATPRTVSVLTGLGATWTRLYRAFQAEVWIGTGATEVTSYIEATWSGSAGPSGKNQLDAYVVRGLTSTTVVGGERVESFSNTGGSMAGPVMGAGPGQFVVSATGVRTNFANSFGVLQTVPTTGWVTTSDPANNYSVGQGYRIPTEYEAHRVDVSVPVNALTFSSVLVVIGDYAGDQKASVGASLQSKNPPYNARPRKTAHAHILGGGSTWTEKAFKYSPISFVGLDRDPGREGYHDYFWAPSVNNTTEARGKGTSVTSPASLIPGDPTGVADEWNQSINYGGTWPQFPISKVLESRTYAMTFKANGHTTTNDYLQLFDDYYTSFYVYNQAQIAANRAGGVSPNYIYPSEIQLSNGPNITFTNFGVEDIVDGQPHFLVMRYDPTNIAFWVDGEQIFDVAHGATGFASIGSVYPWSTGSRTDTIWMDDFVVYPRALDAVEIAALYDGWQGVEDTGPAWQLALDGVLAPKTAIASINVGDNPTTVRWRLRDLSTGEEWTMPINPDSMSSIEPRRQFKFGRGVRTDQRVRAFQTPGEPVEWEWGGVIRTQAHYDQLVAWAEKRVAVEVTDHLGRVFRVYITDFLPTDRTPRPRVSWRLRYSMKARILERVQ